MSLMMASGVHGRSDFLVPERPFSLGRPMPPENLTSCGAQCIVTSPSQGWLTKLCGNHLIVDIANVMVQVVAVRMTESLNIFLDGDRVSQVIIHVSSIKARSGSKTRIINHDAVNQRISIRCIQGRFKIHLVHFPYFELDAIRFASFASPLIFNKINQETFTIKHKTSKHLCIFLRCNIAISKEADQERCDSSLPPQ